MTIVLHIHALSSETWNGQTYCLTIVLQFWQTCSCWNDLVLPSRTTVLWISHNVECDHKIKRINNLLGRVSAQICGRPVADPGNGGQKNMKYMWPPLAAIFMTFSRGLGEVKTLATMMAAHPRPSARESISSFLDFQQVWQLFYGFDRALRFTHSMWDMDILYIVYNVDLGSGLVCRTMQ